MASILILGSCYAATSDTPADDTRRAVEVEYPNAFLDRCRTVLNLETPYDDRALTQALVSQSHDVSRVINTIHGEALLSRNRHRMKSLGVPEVKVLLKEGEPADQLLSVANEHQVDIIIMGCHGQSTLKGLLLGNVSQSVAHQAECTVIMVK